MLTLALFSKIQEYGRKVGNQMRLSTEIKCAFRTIWNSPGQNPTLHSSQHHGPTPTSAIPFTLEQFNSIYSVETPTLHFLMLSHLLQLIRIHISLILSQCILVFQRSSNENEGHNLNHILSTRQLNKLKVYANRYDLTFVPYKSRVFNLHLFSSAISVLSCTLWDEETFLWLANILSVFFYSLSQLLQFSSVLAHLFLVMPPLAASARCLPLQSMFSQSLRYLSTCFAMVSHGPLPSFLLLLMRVSSQCTIWA